MIELDGRCAVVTGAGSGIGRAIATSLAAAGMTVIVSDIEGDAAQETADLIRTAGGDALGTRTDVTSVDDVAALADLAFSDGRDVAVLVNNAGVTLRPYRALWDSDRRDFEWMMRVNFGGVLNGLLAFLPLMRRGGARRHIVNTSSVSSIRGTAGHSAYSASKGAVDGLSLAVREELRTQNIGLTVLYPGAVRTRIATSERLRPADERSAGRDVVPWSSYLDPAAPAPQLEPIFTDYIEPEPVGEIVLNAIRNDLPYVFSHPAPTAELHRHTTALLSGEEFVQSNFR